MLPLKRASLPGWFSKLRPYAGGTPTLRRSTRPTSGLICGYSRASRAVFCAVLALTAVTARAQIKAGDAFPALGESGLVSLDGTTVPQLSGKVTLVDFWASWCAPCKASFPAMARLHTDYNARGLQIVAISVDEKPAAATAFWKKMAPPFSALHDKEQKLVQQVAVPTMPTSYLIDREGKVRAVHIGFRGDLTQLRREIEELLGAKS